MATYPHEETPLTEHEKAAYRYLLYLALVDIRNFCLSRGPSTWNPLEIWRQYHRSRVAGALADWLHNLGFYAARDFRGFDVKHFWREQDSMARRFRECRPGSYMHYRQHYDRRMVELSTREDPDYPTG